MALASGSNEMAMPAAGRAVEVERFAVGLGAELDVADIADPGDPTAVAPKSTLTMMFSNSLGSSSRPLRFSVY